MRGTPVSAEDRLFSLILALLATETGLTKAQIFQTVRGYDADVRAGIDPDTISRKFERDKDDLRALGIPVEVTDSPDAPGDNTKQRYHISKAHYELPADVRFSATEYRLLNLAGEVWREGTVSAHSWRALTKLRSLNIEPDAPILGYVPRIRTRDAVFPVLHQAAEDGAVVSFRYLKPGEQQSELRTVSPYTLGLFEGRWHVLGFDHDRGEERTFLLSRILGDAKRVRGTAHPAPPHSAEALMAGLAQVRERNVAQLSVQPGSAIQATLRNQADTQAMNADGTELLVHFTDAAIFADELASAGPEVLVREPHDLREQVVARLRAGLERHAVQPGQVA